jgi:hypothetical protein
MDDSNGGQAPVQGITNTTAFTVDNTTGPNLAEQQADVPMSNGVPALPVGDTNAAAFLAARAELKAKPNPLPISSLQTGFCYDIRMRFHQTVDYRDTHPEDPRRIYRIYKELALAGLIEDRETASINKNELMLRLRCRYATEEEILLVHSKEHLEEIKSTESTPCAFKANEKCLRRIYFLSLATNRDRYTLIMNLINVPCYLAAEPLRRVLQSWRG